MVFATEKDCPSLLAFLGEESWKSSRKNRKERAYSLVSWVGDRIVTAETCGDMQLLRVTAVLKSCKAPLADQIEDRIEQASLQEDGDYQYSCRHLMGFFLAEVTVYLPLEAKCRERELKYLYDKMNHLLDINRK